MTTVPYIIFMKHAKKITDKVSSSRPILKGVNHNELGLQVTDSHRLYVLANAHTGESKVIDPKTGGNIDGNYPDIRRLVPNPSDAKFKANVNVDTASAATKLIETAVKVDKSSDIIVIKRGLIDLTFQTDEDSEILVSSVMAVSPDSSETFEMFANAKYVAEAFAFLKDARIEKVQLSYYGETRPFTFTAGDLTILILPIKKTLGRQPK